MKRRVTAWMVVVALVVGVIAAMMTPAPAVKEVIDGQELTRLQGTGAWVVDVRTNAEFISGHIANALNVPLDQLPQVAATWDEAQAIVVYCATGARSAEAASYLAAQGFKRVYELDRGIATWTGPVVGGLSASSTPAASGSVKTNGKPVFIDFAGSA